MGMPRQPEDMSNIAPAQLDQWLRGIATTADREIDCDTLFDVIDRVVEVARTGQDIHGLLPEIALHLDHCPDCKDLYETLRELSAEPQ